MVTFHRGSNRRVLVIPQLGVVFKFPHIRLGDAWSILRRAKSRHNRFCTGRSEGEYFPAFLKRQFTEYQVEHYGTLKRSLFKGIADNWRERKYYKYSDRERRQLLQPTYLSLCGFMNIQKYGKPMSCEVPGELYRAYLEVIGTPLNRDGHHFYNEQNFHHTGSSVRLLDYADLATQHILTIYSRDILRRFVPPNPSTS